MMQVIPKSRRREVNGYVKAILALEAVRRTREDQYDRFVRPLSLIAQGAAERLDFEAVETAARAAGAGGSVSEIA